MTLSKARLYLALTILAVAGGYGFFMLRGRQPATPRPQQLPGFRDAAAEAGLSFRMTFLTDEQGETFKINLYDHGCGLAVGDYDGDGHEDIYFLNQLGPNGLFRNKGDGTFEDVTERMDVALEDRICVGATFADYDNDGDQDLYVTSTRGGNVLFRNDDQQALTDVTEAAGLTHTGHSQTAAFFDFDNDSLLDLYLVQTAEWTTDLFDRSQNYFMGKGVPRGGLAPVIGSPKEYNRLYHNKGNGTFTDVTESANMKGRGWSSDVAIFDYDEDGWLDVFVVCMFGRDQLYRNQRDGSFQDVTLETLGRTPWGGIGVKVFDFNNDAKLDILVADMHSDMWMGADYEQKSLDIALESEKVKFDSHLGPYMEPSREPEKEMLEDVLGFRYEEVIFGNAFYQGLGDGKFREVSDETNLETFWPWGITVGDFDNDGNEDAFLASGMGYPFYYWRNYLMMNSGNGLFESHEVSRGIEPPRRGEFLADKIWGKPAARSSRCAVSADFDGDGRLEIVTNNFNDAPYYFRNETEPRNFIAFRLRGVQSNRDAIGALVWIRDDDRVRTRQVHAASGYLSQSTKILHFGLGEQTSIDQVEILWPSGARQTLEAPEINRLHDVIESGVSESDKQLPSAAIN